MYLRLFIFGAVLVASVYLLVSLFNHGFKPVHWSRALLYICSVAMIGVLGEISVDTAYRQFFPTPLWRYNFLPVNHAYTSMFAPVLWGAFGFYVYLVHHKYERWTRQELVKLSVIFGLEAMALEAVCDLVSKPILGNYIYYYYPSGLFHISAFQNFPFYFICGAIVIQTIHWFKAQPHYFTFISAWVTAVTVYLRY